MPEFFIPKNETELTKDMHLLNFDLGIPDEITTLVEKISSYGGKSYLVGGSVRDSIVSAQRQIGLKLKDFDLEVYGISPDELLKRLSEDYEKVKKVGEQFDVYKVPVPGIEEPVDVAIPRTDSLSSEVKKSRGISSESNPNLDLVQAIRRRDFTINSILYDPINRQLVDPFGGYMDLSNGVLRMTDPETFQEDPLRVLRAAQFASRLNFTISDDTAAFSKQLVESGRLNELVRSRVIEEFDKLLIKGRNPSVGLRFLKEIGYLDIVMPELSRLSEIPQEGDYHPEGDAFTHTMQVVDAMAASIRSYKELHPDVLDENTIRALMLGALFHDLGKGVTTVTDEKTGRISSHGHEEAGIPLAQNAIRRIYKTPEQKNPMPGEDLIMLLISDHMRPILLHEEHLRGVNTEKALRRFISRCSQNGVSVDQILMIVEADKLGRNPLDKTKPLSLHQKPDLKVALDWFRSEASKIVSEVASDSKPLYDNSVFLNLDICKGLTQGPWIAVISKCCEMDFIDGEITRDGALERARYYFEKFFAGQDPVKLSKNNKYWADIKKASDPRDFVK